MVGFFLATAIGLGLTGPQDAEAADPKKKQPQQVTQGTSPKAKSEQRPTAPKGADKPQAVKTPTPKPKTETSVPSTHKPIPSTQHSAPGTSKPAPSKTTPASVPRSLSARKAARPPAPGVSRQFHGTFVEAMKAAPFPLGGKTADPHFFDSVDPKTGERFRTSRTLERLSEKDHYRDNSVLFHVPPQFNPNLSFSYVVFFHGNLSNVRQTVTEYRLDEQVNRSGKNLILVLPQFARNAADSSPGKFAVGNAFRTFMQEAALVLSAKLGTKHKKQLEQAPVILVAFSGGYKPLACTLDRGGTDWRIKGVMLLDGLYEDLYIFGKWLLRHAKDGFLVNIYTEGSPCQDKTMALAQFLRVHRLSFKEGWPREVKRGLIALIKSPHEHLQVPIEGPPREPLAEMLRNLKH